MRRRSFTGLPLTITMICFSRIPLREAPRPHNHNDIHTSLTLHAAQCGARCDPQVHDRFGEVPPNACVDEKTGCAPASDRLLCTRHILLLLRARDCCAVAGPHRAAHCLLVSSSLCSLFFCPIFTRLSCVCHLCVGWTLSLPLSLPLHARGPPPLGAFQKRICVHMCVCVCVFSVQRALLPSSLLFRRHTSAEASVRLLQRRPPSKRTCSSIVSLSLLLRQSRRARGTECRRRFSPLCCSLSPRRVVRWRGSRSY